MYCDNLNISNHADWYLPDQDTLKNLFKNKKIFNLLNKTKWYWSSSTKKANEKEYAWVMDQYGNWANALKDSRSSYALCARNI